MLDFCDQPYRYFPPKPNRLWRALLCWHNRVRFLPRLKRITRVEVHGLETLRNDARPGDRLILVPNHPTHADAAILLEAARQSDLALQTMAAYDVFLRSRIEQFVMQRLGAFSVDREGSDPRAMKTALDIVEQGRSCLVIFPEGNVYLENDRVTPFNEGAAFLAMRSAKQLAEQGHRVLVVPVSIKATYTTDIRPVLTERLRAIAKAVDIDLADGPTPTELLRRIGVALLHRNLKLRGLDAPQSDSLTELIAHGGGMVMQQLETKLDLSPAANDTLIDRVRKARRVIHEVRTDPDRIADHAGAAGWADEAMLALRIASYSGGYAAANPAIDRVAETIEKVEEDLHRKMLPPIADRTAYVRYNEPIDLTPIIAGKTKRRAAVGELTAACEASVQRGLDLLNQTNPHPGGWEWKEPLTA